MASESSAPSGGEADHRPRFAPPLTDATLAVALAAADVAQVLLTPDVDRSLAVLLGLSLLTTAPVAWRRAAPLPAALIFGASLLALLAGDYPDFLVGTLAAAVIMPFSVGAHVDSTAVSAIPIGIMLVAGWTDDIRQHHPAGQYLATVLLQGGPWGLARALRTQREQAVRLERLTEELEEQRDQTARAAVIEERNRIARELHDLVAHSISVIAIQSAGAEAALSGDPSEARGPLRLIQRTSREALMEMRRLLEMLRGASPPGLELPGLDDLPKLVEEAEATGTRVVLDLNRNGSIPRTVDLNAYRIVQECLTNVRKHAGPGATANVLIDRGADDLRILVRDDGAGMRDEGNAGHGLLGIRERARLFGGRMTAGSGGDGGFSVDVRIPLPG